MEALFAVAYAVKFMIKKGPSATDYGVMLLEGMWWANDMARWVFFPLKFSVKSQ